MNEYFVTVPFALSDAQQAAADSAGWRISAELHADVMAAAVPTTTIAIRCESAKQAVGLVAEAFDVEPAEVRVEKR